MGKTGLRFGIVVFLGLALLGGLRDRASPKARPLRGPDTKAVNDYAAGAGYQSGPFKPEGFDHYLNSRMEGRLCHKRIGKWVVEILFSRDQTLDINFIDPSDPYPSFSKITREWNTWRTREALLILKTNPELKRLIHLAVGGRIPFDEVIARQEMKLKKLAEGREDPEPWEFTLSPSCYIRVASGKRPLAVGIGY